MKKFVVGPFLAALAMFFWGFLYWGLPHYLPYKAASAVPDDGAAMQALNTIFPASGYYLLPNPVRGEDAMKENVKQGLMQVAITKGPQPAMDPKRMLLGFVHCYVICILLVLLMSRLAPAFACGRARVKFCAELGLLAALYHYTQTIWWYQPIGWVTVGAIYDWAEFVIAGLVLAKFLTPKAVPPVPPP